MTEHDVNCREYSISQDRQVRHCLAETGSHHEAESGCDIKPAKLHNKSRTILSFDISYTSFSVFRFPAIRSYPVLKTPLIQWKCIYKTGEKSDAGNHDLM